MLLCCYVVCRLWVASSWVSWPNQREAWWRASLLLQVPRNSTPSYHGVQHPDRLFDSIAQNSTDRYHTAHYTVKQLFNLVYFSVPHSFAAIAFLYLDMMASSTIPEFHLIPRVQKWWVLIPFPPRHHRDWIGSVGVWGKAASAQRLVKFIVFRCDFFLYSLISSYSHWIGWLWSWSLLPFTFTPVIRSRKLSVLTRRRSDEVNSQIS